MKMKGDDSDDNNSMPSLVEDSDSSSEYSDDGDEDEDREIPELVTDSESDSSAAADDDSDVDMPDLADEADNQIDLWSSRRESSLNILRRSSSLTLQRSSSTGSVNWRSDLESLGARTPRSQQCKLDSAADTPMLERSTSEPTTRLGRAVKMKLRNRRAERFRERGKIVMQPKGVYLFGDLPMTTG